MKKLIMVALAGGIMLSARADSDYLTETVDGISWAYKVVDDVAVIVSRSTYEKIPNPYPYTGYEWGWCYRPSISSNTVGAVSIPSSLGGKPVTSIESLSFYNCDKISALTIPSCITNISASSCIGGCKGLTSIHIDDLEALYTRIQLGGALFKNGIDLYVGGQVVTEAVIPEGVTEINDYAFCNWDKLAKIEIPSSVTNVGKYAFYGCAGLSSMSIPSSVTVIGSNAFGGCSGIKTLKIPQSICKVSLKSSFPAAYNNITDVTLGEDVEQLAAGFFSNCSSLSIVTLPQSLKNISAQAFSNCVNLTGITIPQSVTNIAADAFENCPRLRTEWTKTLSAISAKGVGAEARYDLADYAADRTIASVTVDGDAAIDEFVLTDGKVYDCVLRIVNAASRAVRITLPEGYTYESFAGASPLTLPANSTNMLTITRTGAATFLVSRRRLQAIVQ